MPDEERWFSFEISTPELDALVDALLGAGDRKSVV